MRRKEAGNKNFNYMQASFCSDAIIHYYFHHRKHTVSTNDF